MGPVRFPRQRPRKFCLEAHIDLSSVDENRNISRSFTAILPSSPTLSADDLYWQDAKMGEADGDSTEIIDLCHKLETVHITNRWIPHQEVNCKIPLHYTLDGLDDCEVSGPESSDKAYSRSSSIISRRQHDGLPSTNVGDWRSNTSSLDTGDSSSEISDDKSVTETPGSISLDDDLLETTKPVAGSFLEDKEALDVLNPDSRPCSELLSTSELSFDQTYAIHRILSSCSRACSLNRRLRPSQRTFDNVRLDLPRLDLPDRFILCRNPPGPSRDILLIKTPPSLIGTQRKRVRGFNASDPFNTPLRNRLTLTESVRTLRFQRPARVGPTNPGQVLHSRSDVMNNSGRQVSYGAVWNVGGAGIVNNAGGAVLDGRGGMVGSGTNAPLYVSSFLEASKPRDELELYEKRLALALSVEPSNRVLQPPPTPTGSFRPTTCVSRALRFIPQNSHVSRTDSGSTIQWIDNEWIRNGTPYLYETRSNNRLQIRKSSSNGRVTLIFGHTVLEAPNLRDDFYCSVLAYSHSAQCLAVALADKVYLWTEKGGVRGIPRDADQGRFRSAYVTSVAFSSAQGGNAILAMGRADGRVAMYSPLDSETRFLRINLPTAAAHVSFRPCVVRRQSQRCSLLTADNEVLLIGDDTGTVSVYFIEWPKEMERYTFGWDCAAALHVRVSVHTQQVCGISWSLDGNFFATGGNDNLCCLFNTKQIFNSRSSSEDRMARPGSDSTEDDPPSTVTLKQESVKYLWKLNAAVKAIAFCPWQRGLIAAGGGSNDRCIHFFHTISGACLAKIDCAAQVTSLIWSTTRREIVATFGFAQPEHPFRIAVYAWPSCQQVVAIPWHDEMRALYAIGYPGGPTTGHGGRGGEHRWSRTAEEGCIVVAGSDGSIKFHEIWSEARKATGPHQGLLGGSDILETLHGFDKEGYETIR